MKSARPGSGRCSGKLALGRPGESPFVEITRGSRLRIKFDWKVPYELDGGARPARREPRVKVCPAFVTICVPPQDGADAAVEAGGEHA